MGGGEAGGTFVGERGGVSPPCESPADELPADAPRRPHGGLTPHRSPAVSKIRPYLRLLRLPALFTAPADVLAGYAVAHGGWLPWGPLAALCAAGVCLYAGGMALNDWFDRGRDAAARADRPIPAGDIAPRRAAILGFGLLAAGVCLGALGGWLGGYFLPAVLIAAGVAGMVVLYDGPLKRTVLACPAMGCCRAFNLVLGAAAGPLAAGPLTAAAGMGCYVGGVTWFARNEAGKSRTGTLLAAAGVMNLGFLVLAYAYWTQDWRAAGVDPLLPCGVLAAVAFTIDRRLSAAVQFPGPQTVGPAVRVAVLSVITLNAVTVMAATGDAVLTLATCALLAPAVLLKRVAAVT